MEKKSRSWQIPGSLGYDHFEGFSENNTVDGSEIPFPTT